MPASYGKLTVATMVCNTKLCDSDEDTSQIRQIQHVNRSNVASVSSGRIAAKTMMGCTCGMVEGEHGVRPV